MGTSSSKEVDSNGAVNNNVIIEETMDQNANEITLLLAVICAIKVIEIMVFIYRIIYRQGKKGTPGKPGNLDNNRI